MKQPISKTRKIYILRLIGRCAIFVCALALLIFAPFHFDIIERGSFFSSISPLHILWGVWIIDIICQLIPVGKKISLGSQKLFKNRFKPIKEKINKQALKDHIVSTTKSAYKVLLLWIALLTVIGVLYYTDVIGNGILFLISVAFYVCDLICVLIWCPFRLIMRNRCCTTCRIFNWDHLMMFTPMMFMWSFYSTSLLIMAFLAFLVWELAVLIYPERFWEHSNSALKCSECTDKLCTQYCKKLR